MPSIPRPTTLRIAALTGLPELLEARGVSLDEIASGQGLDPARLRDPDDRITFRQYVDLLDAAALASDDDCLGLHLGMEQSIQVTGVVGYVIQSAPDVRMQLTHSLRYFSLHQDGASISLDTEGEVATLKYQVFDPQVVLHRHDSEQTVAICVNQSRVLTGLRNLAPRSVHFVHPAPAPASERELKRFFGCPVLFSQPFDGMQCSSSVLSTPVRSADPALHGILTTFADERLARQNDSHSFTGQVRRMIVNGLSSGRVAIEDVARQLSVSPRALQRHLSEEGHRFNALVDSTRREMAVEYMRNARISLTDTAFLVGYSDLTAFHRAFRRWFSKTPVEYLRESGRKSVNS